MRAQEFVTEYQKIHRGQLGGIELLFRDSGEHGCRVEASVDDRLLGSADFDRDENILVADQLEVDERYRGQGIAKIMYDYVKSLGYTIERSDNLTDAGRAFWRKNRGRRQVWEQESQQQPQWLYHATYKPLLDSIRRHGLGGSWAQAQWEDSQPGVVYLAASSDIAESYAEANDHVPEQWLDEIVVLRVDARKLDPKKLQIDRNVQDNTGETLEYHGVIPVGSFSALNEEMRLHEFSRTAPNIKDYLVKRGYRFLGAGVDQQAYLEPGTGHVLKVFGTQCDNEGGEPALSDDQRMFQTYAGFCKRNADNPFLPRIYGYETFVFDTPMPKGKNDTGPDRYQKCLYLQIRTEMLKPYAGVERDVLNDMSNAVQENVDWNTYYQDMEYQDDEDARSWYAPVWNRMTNSAEKVRMWGEFYRTMQVLYKLGARQGYAWDLHGDNIMQRSDGTPVIMDPWVIT